MAEGVNSVNDEIKNEAKKVLENKSGIEKVKYFVYYYKVHALVVVGAIAAIIAIVYGIATRKDSILQVMVVNGEYAENYDYETFMDGFRTTVDYDEKKQELIIDPGNHVDVTVDDQYNQAIVQKIFMNVIAQELDVLICDYDMMRLTRSQDVGANMSNVLTEEQLTKYEDKLVWYDFPIEEVGDDDRFTGRNEAVCLEVTDFKKIKETNMFPHAEQGVYLFIPGNSENMELALRFIDYLDE